MREVEAMAMIKHPAALLLVGWMPPGEDGEALIVTDWCPNGTLADALTTERKKTAPEW
jgi:hypothetical protein